MRYLSLLFLIACRGPINVTMPPGSVKAELVIDQPTCWFPEKPTAPQNPEWPSVDEDYYRRQYVHRRDYETLLQYMRDWQEYDDAITTCLAKLSNLVN